MPVDKKFGELESAKVGLMINLLIVTSLVHLSGHWPRRPMPVYKSTSQKEGPGSTTTVSDHDNDFYLFSSLIEHNECGI